MHVQIPIPKSAADRARNPAPDAAKSNLQLPPRPAEVAPLEPRIGHDFSRVRVQSNGQAPPASLPRQADQGARKPSEVKNQDDGECVLDQLNSGQ